jgi:phosphoglycolate phosphatase-like HAD superfamily hydrolase
MHIGASPSGKAAGFGPAIQRFESFRPSFYNLTVTYVVGLRNETQNPICIGFYRGIKMGTPLPDALALDFDGVLCNGLKEYFQTSLRAYDQIWPDSKTKETLAWESIFGHLRAVVETGWEMPLVLRAISLGWSEADILLNWTQIRDQLLAAEKLDWRQIGHQVDTLRDHWIAEDVASWLNLHEFYPGVTTQLSQWIAQDFPVFIITTKESRFVQALLSQVGISLPASKIFGKDCREPKAQTLRSLQKKGFSRVWFVEDRLATLQGICQQDDLQQVGLFLADWGYNTKGDREFALTHTSINLISLEQLSQGFAHWQLNRDFHLAQREQGLL